VLAGALAEDVRPERRGEIEPTRSFLKMPMTPRKQLWGGHISPLVDRCEVSDRWEVLLAVSQYVETNQMTPLRWIFAELAWRY
jgi:hypothetical protein